jgi:hypothetical protein
MGYPINQQDFEFNQRLYEILETLETLNIKFANNSPNKQTAELFNVNDNVMLGNTTDGNTGVTYQNAILGANIPDNLTTSIYSTPEYLFAGTDKGVWIYDRVKNIGSTVNNVLNVSVTQELVLTFDLIANADALVGDSDSVADWNTFFDLPNHGIPFTSVVVTGNSVNLIGGNDIVFHNSLFLNNTHLLSVVDNLGCVIMIGNFFFDGCTSAVTFDFPSLISLEYASFRNCTSAITFNLPSLTSINAGECFRGCSVVTVFDFPALTSAQLLTFKNCSSVKIFNLPKLLLADFNCFEGCTSAVTFNLPSLTTVSQYFFKGCTSAETFNLPACTDLGGTVGNDGVFDLISGQDVDLIIPSSLMTCNAGSPDGDIIYLSLYNTVSINGSPYTPFTGYTGDLLLTFDDIANADLMVGDAHSVSDWNTFFNLPALSTPFVSVTVVGNTVNLVGGENIVLIQSLFGDSGYGDSLLEIVDAGCVAYADSDVFGDYAGAGCPNLAVVTLPKITSVGSRCFANCLSITTFDFPLLISASDRAFFGCILADTFNFANLKIAGLGCFWNCTSASTFSAQLLRIAGNYCFKSLPISSIDFPSLTTAGMQCFYDCTATTFTLPLLISAGLSCFEGCSNVTSFSFPLLSSVSTDCFYGCWTSTTFSFPNLITIDSGAFGDCTSVETLNLPACTDLGGTVGSDGVFDLISGQNVDLIIPSSLMTCNAGSPDGDIIYLSLYNTVSINGSPYTPFTGYTGDLLLTFDAIANADLMVGDAHSVTDWNTFFNLPALSTPFVSVTVVGDTVNLVGGENIVLTQSLFGNSGYGDSLLEIVDAGCVAYADQDVFGNLFGGGCPNLTNVELPSIQLIEGQCFLYCSSILTFNLPSLKSAGESCFSDCSSVSTFSFPNLLIIGNTCFYYCFSAATFDLPLLTTAGDSSFEGCSFVNLFDLPSLEVAGGYCFYDCYNIIDWSFPSLISVGESCFEGFSSAETFDLPNLTTVGDWCFYFCDLATTFDLPLLATAGEGSFQGCSSVSSFSFPNLSTILDWGFYNCSLGVSFDLPKLQSVGDGCFEGCTSAEVFDLSVCTALGATTGDDSVFAGISGNTITLTVPSTLLICHNGTPDGDIAALQLANSVTIIEIPIPIVSNLLLTFDDIANADSLVGNSASVTDWNTFFDLPTHGTSFTSVVVTGNVVNLVGGSGITLKDNLFDGNTHLISVVDTLGCIIIAESYCFNGCTSVLTFDLPTLSSTNNYCFSGCTSVVTIDIPSCVLLGTTTGDDSVFAGISGNTITLTVPAILMTCLSGLPDGDISYLQSLNTVTIISAATPANLLLTWDLIANADALVGDSALVADWNTFFGLPAHGTSFSSVVVTANTVNLIGGSGITLKSNLFLNNTHLISVVDTLGCVIAAENYCFDGCIATILFSLMSLETAGTNCFSNCLSSVIFYLPNLETANANAFSGCTSINMVYFPLLTAIGNSCFLGCTSVETFSIPKLVSAGNYSFSNCSNITTFEFPLLTLVGDYCFSGCTLVETFNIPSCVTLGTTTGNDNVFNGISGKPITLICQTTLLTCNSGNPDGDIVYLQQNNTLKIVNGILPLLGNYANNIFYDQIRFIFYVATDSGGLWVYDVVNNSSTIYNTSTVVTGDSLPSDTINTVAVDTISNIVYVGTDAGLWRYNLTTKVAKLFNTSGGVSSGVNLPSGSVSAVNIDYVNDYVWVGTDAGIWRCTTALNGKTYNTSGGAGSGTQLPSNNVLSVFHSFGVDTLYAGTDTGIWVYDVALDTGSVINTSTSVTGDHLPSNTDVSISHDSVSNSLYVGTNAGVWIADLTLMSGMTYNTTVIPTFGVAIPSNDVTVLWLDSGGNLAVSTNGGGLWILDLSIDYGQVYQQSVYGSGSMPSSVVYGVATCKSTNNMFSATLGGVLQWDENASTGKIFTSAGGASLGDQLPSNICTCTYYDQTNNVFYAGTSLGLWRYTVATTTGKKFTTISGAGSGDQLPNNFVHGIFVDESTNKVYAGTDGGFWIYDTGLDSGLAFTTVSGAGSGDQLPFYVVTDCAKYTGSDYVWAVTLGGGLWRYDEVADIGLTYNTTVGAGLGLQMPSVFGWGVALESNVVWVATNSGVWKYVISSDTGTVVNDATVVLGDPLPSNIIQSVSVDSYNQVLYVGTQSFGLWEYQIGINTGKTFNTHGGQSAGTTLPENNIQSLFIDSTNNNLWAATKGGGVWQYNLSNQGLIGAYTIGLATSTYDYISQTIDISVMPIVIWMMKIEITNSLTFNNIIKYISMDSFGNGYQITIRVGDYISALNNHSGNFIDIPIPDGMIISKDRYFEYPLDPYEIVDMTIYYTRLEVADIIRGKLDAIMNPFFDISKVGNVNTNEDNGKSINDNTTYDIGDSSEIAPKVSFRSADASNANLPKIPNAVWWIVGGVAFLVLLEKLTRK